MAPEELGSTLTEPDVGNASLREQAENEHSLNADNERWRYREAVPNAPGEPPNTTPVLPDIDGAHTGLFLQQFTNSVNKALHKQNCTCKGKVYTSEDLYEKSNPAIFARSKSDSTLNSTPRKILKLPRLVGYKSAHVDTDCNEMNTVDTSDKPPLQSQIEREMKEAQLYGLYFVDDPMEQPIRDENGEIRLPNIMDIHDLSGNSWKIIQEPQKPNKQKKKSRFDRKLFGENVNEQNDGMKVLSAKSKASKVKETELPAVSNLNTIHVVLSSATPNNSVINQEAISESSLESESIVNFDETEFEPLCHTAQTFVSQAKSPPFICDELGRKTLLWRYTSAVRKGEITYREYLRKVSEISSLYREEDSCGNHPKREHSPKAAEDEDLIKIPRAEFESLQTPKKETTMQSLPSAYERRCNTVNVNTSFPPELEFLYSKGGLSISNLSESLSQSLPANFLQLERERLRNEYPMYDWKISREAQLGHSGQIKRADVPFGPHDKKLEKKGIGPSDFDHKLKVQKSKPGSDSNVVNIRGSQFLSKTGELSDLPETESVKKLSTRSDEESSRIASGMSRGLPPNQPPTTPVEIALTHASCSVPNILETMEEEDDCREDAIKGDDARDRGAGGTIEDGEEPMSHSATVDVGKTNQYRASAKSRASERSWKEGFDGKMYKVSKNRPLKIGVTVPTGSPRKQSVDSVIGNEDKVDETSTVSTNECVPRNPCNSNENLNDNGFSSFIEGFIKTDQNAGKTKSPSIKVIGGEILPEISKSELKGSVRKKSSSKSSEKSRKNLSPKPFHVTKALSGPSGDLQVSLSTKSVVFVSPIQQS